MANSSPLPPADSPSRSEDPPERPWTAKDSEALYQVQDWGYPYFSVNDKGRIEVRPNPAGEGCIDLFELIQDLQARGLELPVLIRFSDIIAHRIQRIHEAFARAIEENEYKGRYRGVYPIKVNQQRHVVEEVVEAGRPWDFGLEVGSKPELLIALAAMKQQGGLIICNGYKDATYMETALIAQRFGETE